MPVTNKIIDTFLGSDAMGIKPVSARAREEDIKLVQEVFPEAGFTSYLSGLIFKKLADELREANVTNVAERHNIEEFVSLEDFRDSLAFNLGGDEDAQA